MRDNVKAERPEGNASFYHHVAPTVRRLSSAYFSHSFHSCFLPRFGSFGLEVSRGEYF
jgi:hypothetical protein